MEKKELNRLIGEFMGWKYSKKGTTASQCINGKWSPRRLKDIQFDTSWDWLMPVWQKISIWGWDNHENYWKQQIGRDEAILNFYFQEGKETFTRSEVARLLTEEMTTRVAMDKLQAEAKEKLQYSTVESIIVKNERYQVDNGSGGDHVSNFFIEVAIDYSGTPRVETKDYKNSNDRLSILKIDDKTIAHVVETRTEFNHVEFVFSKLQKHQSNQEAVELIKLKICQHENWQNSGSAIDYGYTIKALTDLLTQIKR